MGATMAERTSVSAKGWATTLVGVAAALTAVHLLGASHAAGDTVTAWGADSALQVVDRTHKGDRLDAASLPASDVHASGRMALRHLMRRAHRRQMHETCEPPASPYVDPQLAKLPGRCLT